MKLKGESTKITASNEEQLEAREIIWEMFKTNGIPEEELERNLGLFIRGSQLARILTISDIYQMIINIPGHIFDFGTWRGQNAILCENLRAIFEPFNKQRKIVAFDTFEGYTSSSEDERKTKDFNKGAYSVGKEYDAFLLNLLQTHEKSNVLPNVSCKHEVIKGNVLNTLPEYFTKNNETIISLAFFDMNLKEPTLFALEKIKRRLIPGSVVCLMQLQRNELPGEALAYLDIKDKLPSHKLVKMPLYNTMNLIVVD